MWVFDGEEWYEEGSGESTSARKPESRPRFEELMPELQVIEVVIPVPKTNHVPPMPLP
jgi:hypothetical protein